MKLNLRPFLDQFGTIFRGLRASKIKFSYHRGTIFEDFGRCKMRCNFGGVLGRSGGGFWELFGPRFVDFVG